MRSKRDIGLFWMGVVAVFFMVFPVGPAAGKTVVIPLYELGPVGDAGPADVLKGKTFSSRAGVGLTGSLEVRDGGATYTNTIGMTFSLIPAGSFVMGSPDGTGVGPDYLDWPGEDGRGGDEKQHVVSLTESFFMQTTEVTQGQWEQVMGGNPSHFSSCGSDCPVEQVSWDEAQAFIAALNANEGRTNCDTAPNTCYVLPTEAQWEYAARGGTVTAFYNGGITNTGCSLDSNLDKIGWYCGNAGGATHPVAQKEPNNWGLYDMSGNVWEWCNDWYEGYPDGPEVDPLAERWRSLCGLDNGGWSCWFKGLRS